MTRVITLRAVVTFNDEQIGNGMAPEAFTPGAKEGRLQGEKPLTPTFAEEWAVQAIEHGFATSGIDANAEVEVLDAHTVGGTRPTEPVLPPAGKEALGDAEDGISTELAATHERILREAAMHLHDPLTGLYTVSATVKAVVDLEQIDEDECVDLDANLRIMAEGLEEPDLSPHGFAEQWLIDHFLPEAEVVSYDIVIDVQEGNLVIVPDETNDGS